MSCKGKECTVQHRNPDCKGGRHARELRAVIKERDQLKKQLDAWKEAAESGENLANGCEVRRVTIEWPALDFVVRNLRVRIGAARVLDGESQD